jgi:type VI secretion system protein ImpK
LLVFRSDGAFDVGQADFKPSFINNIARVGLALAPWPGDLEVIGHTDSQPIQSRLFPNNMVLSEARAKTAANALAEYVTQQGSRAPSLVVQRQILVSGRGDSEPVDKSSTPVAFERNRRVDVLWKVAPRSTLSTQNEPQSQPFSTESSLPLQRDQLRERP